MHTPFAAALTNFTAQRSEPVNKVELVITGEIARKINTSPSDFSRLIVPIQQGGRHSTYKNKCGAFVSLCPNSARINNDRVANPRDKTRKANEMRGKRKLNQQKQEVKRSKQIKNLIPVAKINLKNLVFFKPKTVSGV